MARRDPRIDAYIENAQPFARPILRHLRQVVHAACPEVEEDLKWQRPHFGYKGIMCGMAAFKQHCVFGFWRGAEIVKAGDRKDQEAMGQFGRITALTDLPPDRIIRRYVKAAMAINDGGVKPPMREKRKPKRALPVPSDLARALNRSRKAKLAFEGFSPSHRREYIEWITEAKAAETRTRRLETAIEWMAAGKPRNWKYMPTKSA